ncbi:MAG TPA: hypothetical protein VGJ22_14210 [Anaerolineales bacterium]|jgi:hypothetical protein
MCFVNSGQQTAREILDVDHEIVSYNAYDLNSGKLCGAPLQRAPKGQLIRWADREATEEEAARLQRKEVAAVFEVENSLPIETAPMVAVMAEAREEARRNSFTN